MLTMQRKLINVTVSSISCQTEVICFKVPDFFRATCRNDVFINKR